MVRETERKQLVYGETPLFYFEFAGLSTDTPKPSECVATGSLFLEVDTGDVYAYDEEGETWDKIASLGGAEG